MLDRLNLPTYDTVVDLAVSICGRRSIPQQDLDHRTRWDLKWDMEFNPSKYVVTHVTRFSQYYSPKPVLFAACISGEVGPVKLV